MSAESQEKPTKYHGTGRIIARKTGYNEDYISRVLNGKVNREGKKARHILELAGQITAQLEALYEE